MARYGKFGKESVYGTPVAGSVTVPIIKESLSLKHGSIRSKTVDSRALTKSVGGPKLVGGGWEQYLNYANCGLSLAAVFGSEAYSSPDTGVGLHKFTYNALTLPSLTARIGLHDVKEKICHGIGIDTFKLEASPDDFLKAIFGVVGEDITDDTVDAAPSFSTQDYATVTNTFTLAGSAATPENLEITVKNNLKKNNHNITSRTLPRLELGELDITGKMSIRFLAATHLDNFLAGTRVKLIAKWQGALITGTSYNFLQVTLDSIEYDASEAFVDKQKRLVEDLPFTVVKVGTDIIEVQLQNTDTASYL